MAILTLQKRARSLGRIRIGQVVPTSNGKTRPEKLDRFRLTSPSKELLDKAAALYGGTVQEWTPQGGGAKQWEVLTDSRRIPIMVPPQPVTQFLETWAGGICVHRCDGYTELISGEQCDPEDQRHLDARPTTRLNVVLRDVEGIGVWRLESKGWNAAMELPDAAEFLAQAGGYVEGWLSLEERVSRSFGQDGKPQTRRFMVPIIEIDVTPAELMAGRGRVQPPELEGPVPKVPELEAGASTDPYAEHFARLEAAASIPELQQLWKDMVELHLVGSHATPSQRATEFVEAYTAKGTALSQTSAAGGGDPSAPPVPSEAAAPVAEPDADGVVDAELVDEDADAVWLRIVSEAAKHGLTRLPDLEDDCSTFLGGMSSAEASAGELGEYLKDLQSRPAEAGAA